MRMKMSFERNWWAGKASEFRDRTKTINSGDICVLNVTPGCEIRLNSRQWKWLICVD